MVSRLVVAVCLCLGALTLSSDAATVSTLKKEGAQAAMSATEGSGAGASTARSLVAAASWLEEQAAPGGVGLEEEDEMMDCGKDPDDWGWGTLAFKFCEASDGEMKWLIGGGVGSGIYTAISHATGIGQATSIGKSIYKFGQGIFYAICLDGENAGKSVSCSVDSLRSAFDPTLWVAGVVEGGTQAATSGIFASTLALMAAHLSVFPVDVADGGLGHPEWLAPSVKGKTNIPVMLTGPDEDAGSLPTHLNPFLTMILADKHMPNEVKTLIEGQIESARAVTSAHLHQRGAAATVVPWADLAVAVVEGIKSSKEFVALLTARGYGSVLECITCGSLDGDILSAVLPPERIRKTKQSYYGPFPDAPPQSMVMERLLGGGGGVAEVAGVVRCENDPSWLNLAYGDCNNYSPSHPLNHKACKSDTNKGYVYRGDERTAFQACPGSCDPRCFEG